MHVIFLLFIFRSFPSCHHHHRRHSPSAPSGGPPQVQRLGLLSSCSKAPPPALVSLVPALRRTMASSLSFSLRSETGKKRHSRAEPSLRRRPPGDTQGGEGCCAIMVTAATTAAAAAAAERTSPSLLSPQQHTDHCSIAHRRFVTHAYIIQQLSLSLSLYSTSVCLSLSLSL